MDYYPLASFITDYALRLFVVCVVVVGLSLVVFCVLWKPHWLRRRYWIPIMIGILAWIVFTILWWWFAYYLLPDLLWR